ncbi:MAG: NYN domain-containing protein, partial [Acidimicrobiales bacterium]
MESTLSARRRIVVDGSNIATEGRATPSLAQLDEAIRAFLDEYPGFTTADVTVVVDATFGHRIDPSEVGAFEQAVEHGEMVTPPAGAVGRGDGFILRIADKAGALVLSNDSFQEFHSERPWLFEPGRLIGGKPVPGVGWVFTPRTPVRGAVSRAVTTRSKRTPEPVDASFPLAVDLEPEQGADRKVQGREVTGSAKGTGSATGTRGKTSAGRAKAAQARKPAKSTRTAAADVP